MADNDSDKPKKNSEIILDVSKMVDTRIQFESGWIAQRMTWLVISQSFLFSALATTTSSQSWTNALKETLLWTITLLGFVQAAVAFVSILAAKAVNSELLILRGKIDETLKQLLKAIDEQRTQPDTLANWVVLGKQRNGSFWMRNSFFLGGLASYVIPISLIVAWLVLLIFLMFEHPQP